MHRSNDVMRHIRYSPFFLVVLLFWMGSTAAHGQVRRNLDQRLFYGVYEIDHALMRRSMRAADATVYPVFILGAPFTWAGEGLLRSDPDLEAAYLLTVSELAALGSAIALKVLFQRTRPYVRFDDVASRTGDIARRDPYSFPSGHAALSFALATSWSLTYPEWYVIAPAYLWASGVSMSRIWLGVHYPGDVLAGMVLGAGVSLAVHALRGSITPGGLK